MGYQAKSKVLEIEFQSRAVYQYFDVPETVHEEFWKAESKGKYFNLEIRDGYPFVLVGETQEAKEAAPPVS
jgi:hypothetical protein